MFNFHIILLFACHDIMIVKNHVINVWPLWQLFANLCFHHLSGTSFQLLEILLYCKNIMLDATWQVNFMSKFCQMSTNRYKNAPHCRCHPISNLHVWQVGFLSTNAVLPTSAFDSREACTGKAERVLRNPFNKMWVKNR